MNESPESPTSADETEAPPPHPAPDDADLAPDAPAPEADSAGTSEQTQIPPLPARRPPRTQQFLTAAVLALIVLSFILLAVEIAQQ